MSRNILRNKNAISTLIIALIVVVVVVAVAGGAYYVMTQNNPNSPSESPTPSPSIQATATPAVTPTGSASPTVAPSSTATNTPAPSSTPVTAVSVTGASSLQYSVSLTEAGVAQGSYTYSGKNVGTTNFMMRIDATDDQGNQSSYIVNGADQKAWSYADGKWTDLSPAYAAQFNLWNQMWQSYVTSLSAWNGLGDYSYTSGTSTVRIFNISVNPALSDSLFQHN